MAARLKFDAPSADQQGEMTTSDSLLGRLLPGLLVAAVVFGAWWLFIRDGGGHPVPQQGPGVLDTPSSAQPYLLQASQLGPNYNQLADDTRAVTAAEIRAGQSPAALKVIRSSWKNGARAGWTEVNGSVTVDSESELFTGSDLSPVSDGIRKHLIARYHASKARPPGVVPAGAWFLTGRTISQIYSTEYSPKRQVAVAGWQHGDVLAVVVVTGLPRDGVAEIAAKLATTQDGNIRYVAAG
jgi:hypothetical protein